MEISLSSNIEAALFRTRQVMEESKAITMKNYQRKNMLKEKLQHDNMKPEKEESSLNNSDIIRRVSEIDIRNHLESLAGSDDSAMFSELKNEIQALRRKITDQSLHIKFLETKLAEVSSEKVKLVKELKAAKKCHESEIQEFSERQEENKTYIHYRNSSDSLEICEMKQRISILEDKYKQQIMSNHDLIENIKRLQNNDHKEIQCDKINELEGILIESMKKYKNLKERLEKTESILEIDRTYQLSHEISLTKRSALASPKQSHQNKSQKIIKNKSTIAAIGGKTSIHKRKRNELISKHN